MRTMTSGLGALLVIQGVGGLINQVTNGARSWFVVNYLEVLQGVEIPVSIVILGLALVGIGRIGTRRRSARRD